MSDIAVAESGSRLQNFLDRAGLRGFPWKTATILYTISWGWLFIVRDSMWAHDWDSFAIPDFAEFAVDDYGFAPWTLFEVDLFNAYGSSIFRYITFLLFFGASVCLFGISKHLTLLADIDRRFLALLFLILPFHTARVALMVFKYTTAYFLFFIAWYLIVSFRRPAVRYICVVIFFLSFQMHSLLFFYLLPVAHLFFLENGANWRLVLAWGKRNLHLLLLPIVYTLSRSVLWPERYKYHGLGFQNFRDSLGFITSAIAVLLIFMALLNVAKQKYRKDLKVILIGLSSLFLGILPYVLYRYFAKTQLPFLISYFTTAIGRSNWNSRHLILQPLGFGLVFVGLIGMVVRNSQLAKKLLVWTLLSACVVFNIGFGFEHITDHLKQEEIIKSLENYGDNESKSQIEFIDQTTLLNARGQKMYSNSWSGLIWRSYGIESAHRMKVDVTCESVEARLVLIQGPRTHWQALKNWVSDGDMGFKVTVDDSPGACKPEMVTSEKVSGAIPILFYFTGAKG
jgi:hypothetical protein